MLTLEHTIGPPRDINMVAAYIIPIQVPNTWWPTLFLLYRPCGTHPGEVERSVSMDLEWQKKYRSQSEQFFGGKVFSNVFRPKPKTLRLQRIWLNQCSCISWALWGFFCNMLYMKSTRLVIRMNELMLVACRERLQNSLSPLTCFVFLTVPICLRFNAQTSKWF